MRQCMDAENLHRRLKKVIGQVQAIDLLARRTRAGGTVVLFNLREPSLHEIFVETVGGESDA